MGERRTFASVTDTPCTCDFLQRAADDPDQAIEFDAQTGEYQFVAGSSRLVIYHCPFCGGAAPESKRPLLFAIISPEEEQRLATLLAPIKSIRAALKRLGKPQRDDASGMRVHRPESANESSVIEHFRTLSYERLSDVADVRIAERPDGSVHWSLQGKFIGMPKRPHDKGTRDK
jgi:hypothetical protein